MVALTQKPWEETLAQLVFCGFFVGFFFRGINAPVTARYPK